MQNPESYDEGGLVLGDVECRPFFNKYGKCAFIDGNLDGSELLAAAFGDSSLVFIGSLKTNFFFGRGLGQKSAAARR